MLGATLAKKEAEQIAAEWDQFERDKANKQYERQARRRSQVLITHALLLTRRPQVLLTHALLLTRYFSRVTPNESVTVISYSRITTHALLLKR